MKIFLLAGEIRADLIKFFFPDTNDTRNLTRIALVNQTEAGKKVEEEKKKSFPSSFMAIFLF